MTSGILPSADRHIPGESGGKEMMVFVVDDDEAVRDSLKLLLESYGLNVEDYASAEAFAGAYRPRGRACLILDQNLPGMTGLDFLASAQDLGIDIPVILVTAQGDRTIRMRAQRLGAAAYFEKPVDDRALIAAIQSAINGDSSSLPARPAPL
jgi:two-component system, LuxR family, response regulator FixJ